MEFKELVLMRIFLGESDRYADKPLYRALVEFLHQKEISGVTVIKGAMGFGQNSKIHSDRFLRLSSDLPIVIEVVDSQEKFDMVLPQIKKMFQGGLITFEKISALTF
jgi:PII-like signaling protein